ncbi:unnamed protein product, partial [Debaryomyces tyrocola]
MGFFGGFFFFFWEEMSRCRFVLGWVAAAVLGLLDAYGCYIHCWKLVVGLDRTGCFVPRQGHAGKGCWTMTMGSIRRVMRRPGCKLPFWVRTLLFLMVGDGFIVDKIASWPASGRKIQLRGQ